MKLYWSSHEIVTPDQRGEPELEDIENYYLFGEIVFTHSDRYSTFINATNVEDDPFINRKEMKEMPLEKFVYHKELIKFIFEEMKLGDV